MLHTDLTDIDYHQQDVRAARSRGLISKDEPWCQCESYHGGIVTCRRCGRIRRPANLNLHRLEAK